MKNLPMTETDYQILRDAYDGSGGFLDGTYLTRHKRETEENYRMRKDLSFYLNYTKVVIRSHVNAIFSKDPSRKFNDNQLFQQFIDDCDGLGTPLNKWMKRASIKAKLFGSIMIIIDNSKNQPKDLQSAIDQRTFPYLYLIETSRVTDWTTNEIGNLDSITYSKKVLDEKGVTVTHQITWTTSQVFEKNEKGDLVSIFDHNLGILPIVIFYGSDNPKENVVPVSEFLSVARANKAVFNICSEIREIQRHQGFNILTIPGDPPTEKKKIVGTENALYYPNDSSNSPAFIAPNSAPLDKLESFLDRLISEIYRMSCVTYTQQYAVNQSGESKKWTFHITRQELEDFALNCENTEEAIGKIFGKYIQSDIQFTVNYNRKYGPDDIDTDIARAQLAIDLNLGKVGNVEVRKDIARKYFSDIPDEDINSILDSIDTALQEDTVNQDADNAIKPEQQDNTDGNME